MWAAFDSFTPNIRRIVAEAGVNVTTLEVKDRIDSLRAQGATEAEIERWLENGLKALTHIKYAQAGHPLLQN